MQGEGTPLSHPICAQTAKFFMKLRDWKVNPMSPLDSWPDSRNNMLFVKLLYREREIANDAVVNYVTYRISKLCTERNLETMSNGQLWWVWIMLERLTNKNPCVWKSRADINCVQNMLRSSVVEMCPEIRSN
jgi:hypothetical protein